MTRLIDADALYENLGFAKECEDCDHQYNSVFCESSTWQVVCDAIYEAPTIDVPHWIPCKERLPETTGKYLVSVKNGNVYANVFDGFSKKFQCAAVAWMPLPDPYKEEMNG